MIGPVIIINFLVSVKTFDTKIDNIANFVLVVKNSYLPVLSLAAHDRCDCTLVFCRRTWRCGALCPTRTWSWWRVTWGTHYPRATPSSSPFGYLRRGWTGRPSTCSLFYMQTGNGLLPQSYNGTGTKLASRILHGSFHTATWAVYFGIRLVLVQLKRVVNKP